MRELVIMSWVAFGDMIHSCELLKILGVQVLLLIRLCV
jgi:hypothetical protein